MSPMDLLLPTYRQMLKALLNWLDKAETQMPGGRAEALLAVRLAPEMFPLSTQIRFACVQPLEGMARLNGDEFPPSRDILLDEGRNAGERPGSIADARRRIEETIAVLDNLTDSSRPSEPQRQIAHALPTGIIFDLTVDHYARDWTLPQFYFHLMIAYAILRSEGVDIGKVDYVSHMFAYLRPGTMPSA
jgi:hypothetical protein